MDLNDVIEGWNPREYLEAMIRAGDSHRAMDAIVANGIECDDTRSFFRESGQIDEVTRVTLEEHMRILLDTFLLSRVIEDDRKAGNAMLTVLVHNLARVLAVAVMSGSSAEVSYQAVCARLQDEMGRYLENGGFTLAR